MPTKNKYIGSSFDDFLEQCGILEEVNATAMKRAIAWQIQEAMKAQHLTKTAMAARMGTSRAALNRLLDDRDTSLTLATLATAAAALGKRLNVEFVPA
jgi:DNA-binding Xre family transcriptional regulator